jgi:uncharacterized protein YjbI with pentapeptide repeats
MLNTNLRISQNDISIRNSTDLVICDDDINQSKYVLALNAWCDTGDTDRAARFSTANAIQQSMSQGSSTLDLSNSHQFINLTELPPLPPSITHIDISGLPNLGAPHTPLPNIKLTAIGTDLSNLDLSGCQSGGDLTGAKLPLDPSKICLSGMKLDYGGLIIALKTNMALQNADLSGLDLHDINLSGLDLQGVNLQNSNLGRASLSGSNLSGANLCGTKLRRTNLQNANLSGFAYDQATDLESADLRGATLSSSSNHAISLSQTKLCENGINFSLQKGMIILNADTSSANNQNINFNHINIDNYSMRWALKNGMSSQHLFNNGAILNGSMIEPTHVHMPMAKSELFAYQKQLTSWAETSTEKSKVANYLLDMAANGKPFHVSIISESIGKKNSPHVSVDGLHPYHQRNAKDFPPLPSNCHGMLLSGSLKHGPSFPSQLHTLTITGAPNLKDLPPLPPTLTFLNITDCPKLKKLEGSTPLLSPNSCHLNGINAKLKLSDQFTMPGPLQLLTHKDWDLLSQSVYQNICPANNVVLKEPGTRKVAIESATFPIFYNEIWEKYSDNKVDYAFSTSDSAYREAEWASALKAAEGNNLPFDLKYGKAAVQGVHDAGDPEQVKMGRLARTYQVPNKSDVARIQFVAKEHAGLALYEAVGKAIDKFILNECDDNEKACPVSLYKAFGEDGQKGRSESGVIYLVESPNSPRVQKFINKYLSPAIQEHVSELPLIGMTPHKEGRINVATIPPEELQRKLLHDYSQGSQGGLMATILRESYVNAANNLISANQEFTPQNLTGLAQVHAKRLWTELNQ